MRIVEDRITVSEREEMAARMFGGLVKAVVDVDRARMAVDAEMHADEEALLLGEGASQSSLWGIDLYPEAFGTPDFVEFDSVINIRPSQRPSQGNRSRAVDDPSAQERIREIVARLVVR